MTFESLFLLKTRYIGKMKGMSYARHINWYTFEMQVMVAKHM